MLFRNIFPTIAVIVSLAILGECFPVNEGCTWRLSKVTSKQIIPPSLFENPRYVVFFTDSSGFSNVKDDWTWWSLCGVGKDAQLGFVHHKNFFTGHRWNTLDSAKITVRVNSRIEKIDGKLVRHETAEVMQIP